ncbi:hypothetical protein DL93DRAFT_591784 [Clavulina sp. PMI_390]|nr:hypothetical protein DL93DRAFT_591784 [Clavulina sp. PMI_390]
MKSPPTVLRSMAPSQPVPPLFGTSKAPKTEVTVFSLPEAPAPPAFGGFGKTLSSTSTPPSNPFTSTKNKTPAPPPSKPTVKPPTIITIDEEDEDLPPVQSSTANAQRPIDVDSYSDMDDVEIEEIEDDGEDEIEEDGASVVDDNGRHKSPSPVPVQRAASVEEPDDRKGPASAPKRNGTTTRPSLNGNMLHPTSFTASPVVPSPLRQVSIPPEDDELASDPEEMVKPVHVPNHEPKKEAVFKVPAVPAPSLSPQARAKQLNLTALPKFELFPREHLMPTKQAFSSTGGLDFKAKQSAILLPSSKLPTFDLSTILPALSSPTVVMMASVPPPSKGFDWSAVGSKPPTPASDKWTCGDCSCQSPATAQKCIVCDAPRPGGSSYGSSSAAPLPPPVVPPTAPAAAGSFNWAAAGSKPPAPASDKWTCGDCACQSPATAQKCIVCDAPRPGVSTSQSSSSATLPPPAATPAAPAAATGSFNWAAAGFKPSAPPSDQWTCPTCSCQSPTSAQKCTVCDADRPGAATPGSSSAAPTPASAPAPPMAPPSVPSGGFNWGAAGITAPKATGSWTCDMCACESPADKDECVVCQEPRPGKTGASSSSSAAAPAAAPTPPIFGAAPPKAGPPAPPSGGFSFGGGSFSSPSSSSTITATTSGFGFKPTGTSGSSPFSGFAFGAPASKPAAGAPASSEPQWTCDLCGLKNPESAKKECTICSAPRP